MTEPQPIDALAGAELPARAATFRDAAWRLMQICCTVVGGDFELLYSFARGNELQSFRVVVPRPGATLPSITDAFLCAFTYENEIHDLFGITFAGLKLDFGGNFLKARFKSPFVMDRPMPDDPEKIPAGNCAVSAPAAAQPVAP
jgi:ech hydrogenase subunit D